MANPFDFSKVSPRVLAQADPDVSPRRAALRRIAAVNRSLIEDLVRHDAHVAPHPPERVQQRQRVQRAGRMIGDDQQSAARRNRGELGLVQLVAQPQEVERGIHEFESLQLPALLQEGFDGLES